VLGSICLAGLAAVYGCLLYGAAINPVGLEGGYRRYVHPRRMRHFTLAFLTFGIVCTAVSAVLFPSRHGFALSVAAFPVVIAVLVRLFVRPSKT